MNTKPAMLAIHGGAGTILRQTTSLETEQAYLQALRDILRAGEVLLAQGATALDVVQACVCLLEENERFNAGRGAVYTAAATHELDASIMEGHTRRAGAVAGLRTTRNPVRAARAVMEFSGHVMLIGPAADAFAMAQGLEQVAPDWFGTPQRLAQLRRVQGEGGAAILDHDGAQCPAPLDERQKFGTVGAVALDAHGRLAAATSTGGMTNKKPGRVGDSPILGAGCYADDTVAISCTGTGEAFMRSVAAHEVSAQMRYLGRSLEAACEDVVGERLPAVGGQGGLIAVSHKGELCLPFNTEGMYRGWVRLGEAAQARIFR
ncbi:isoaspartyl peptidase/L-asparaginase [Mitsuaria sp. WAJ17]|uniref:isoaspartyl peptidase/L-asparaginase family protein n=1 Tax=Mitsuaria sp. WAJ17 TaxID=2761452 RepID=UPI001601229E|nr:isoaspartyl peptidase/L-asparaginase [Mitsuaria sp. WAJ17]MBB2486866.1 isoaspartyl peptidase/L-asparaginase [Mitsuaria sp. WAJ17]